MRTTMLKNSYTYSGNSQEAFTLIEVMLVLMILGMLVVFAAGKLGSASEDAKRDIARIYINGVLSTALERYELRHSKYPASLNDLTVKLNGYGPHLDQLDQDPWKRDYQYTSPGSHKPKFDIWSQGQDPGDPSDDVSNWDRL